MTDDQRPVEIPQMCELHQRLLLDQVGIGPKGPWRAHIIVAQIVMFQGATARQETYDHIGGDVYRIGELGCLACFRPDMFGEVVQAFQKGGMAAAKALGESFVTNAAIQEGTHGE